MQTREMQLPNVKTMALFKSKASTASKGNGTVLAASRVLKMTFSFAVRTGRRTNHPAAIAAMAMSDHDKEPAVK